MTVLETFNERREQIKSKLKSIELPTDGSATQLCWNIGTNLNVTGPTVRNYLSGEVKDGYLAEAIYDEFKRIRKIKK